MMRRTVWGPALLACVLAAPAHAQSSRDKVTFANVRVGFTPGPHAGNSDEMNVNFRQPHHKPGAWVPVYVDVLNSGKYDEKDDGPIEILIETMDADDASHTYRVPLPPFTPENPSSKIIGYTRPGSRYSDFVVRAIRRKDGRDLCQPHRVSHPGLDTQQVLYLTLGSKLPGVKLPGTAGNPNAGQGASCEIGHIARVDEMPAYWFGYNAADLVILGTGDRAFLSSLLNDTAGRKAALAEWVRRGGKLLVLVGKNFDMFGGQGFEELNSVLPVDAGGKPLEVAELRPVWREYNAGLDPVRGPITLARLASREGRNARVLADGPKESGGSPLVVQGAYGLGKVTVVAADLDLQPFTKWTGIGTFWQDLLKQSGPRVPANVMNNQFGRFVPRNMGGMGDEGDASLRGVVQQLEAFEGVPVISFGWVALFIVLYILVVGPIDYLFLKKVVKRLEFTWITFPTVVIAVSAAAYFTAYALKGNDLRINKSDIVDIDLQTKQAYGRTWFSVFSPRIQNYTIAVEPAEGWAAAPANGSPDAIVTWFGAPKQGQRSLFRRSYEYEDKAAALRRVPIQVWSTKNFQAQWEAGFNKDKPPFAAELKHPPGKADDLIGTVTNRLPVELLDAVLIYRGEVAYLGRLAPDSPRPVSAQARVKFATWKNAGGGPEGAGGAAVANQLQMNLLFHDEMAGTGESHNGSLRDLDQSWRVTPDNRDEAILVARLDQSTGKAEPLTQGPGTACRLWLGEVPWLGRPRPEIPGDMRQDTLVRVYVPVAAK